MNYNDDDGLKVWHLVLFIAIIGSIAIYMAGFAECQYLTWMSVTEIPSRCLK